MMQSLSIKYMNAATSLAIIRISREFYREFMASIFFITHIMGRRVKINSLYCGGTIRAVEKRAYAAIK